MVKWCTVYVAHKFVRCKLSRALKGKSRWSFSKKDNLIYTGERFGEKSFIGFGGLSFLERNDTIIRKKKMEKPQSYISLTPSQVLGNSLKGKLVVESRGDYSLIVDSFPLLCPCLERLRSLRLLSTPIRSWIGHTVHLFVSRSIRFNVPAWIAFSIRRIYFSYGFFLSSPSLPSPRFHKQGIPPVVLYYTRNFAVHPRLCILRTRDALAMSQCRHTYI